MMNSNLNLNTLPEWESCYCKYNLEEQSWNGLS